MFATLASGRNAGSPFGLTSCTMKFALCSRGSYQSSVDSHSSRRTSDPAVLVAVATGTTMTRSPVVRLTTLDCQYVLIP